MKNLLATILCSAAHSMWQKDPTLGTYESETEQHELNLSFHYACELRRWFSWLDSDFDLSKRMNFPNTNRTEKCIHKRPDIIFHRRRTHFLNFLVVEVKRKRNQSAVPKDIERIRYKWMESPYRYRFGASIVIADARPEFIVRVLAREDRQIEPFLLSDANMGEPLRFPNFADRKLSQQVDLIVATKKARPPGDTTALEEQLDVQFRAFYETPRA